MQLSSRKSGQLPFYNLPRRPAAILRRSSALAPISTPTSTGSPASVTDRICRQDIIAYGGDSGGAVFSDFTYDGFVNAAGILSGGNTITVTKPDGTKSKRPCLKSDIAAGTVADCYVVHMPIDRLNDDPNFGSILTQ